MFEIKTKCLKYFRRLRLESILAGCTTLSYIEIVVFELQKILLNNFSPNVSIWIGILNATCMQKISSTFYFRFARFYDLFSLAVFCTRHFY